MTERNSRFSKKYGQIRFLIRRGLRAAIDVIRSLVRAIVRTNKPPELSCTCGGRSARGYAPAATIDVTACSYLS